MIEDKDIEATDQPKSSWQVGYEHGYRMGRLDGAFPYKLACYVTAAPASVLLVAYLLGLLQ